MNNTLLLHVVQDVHQLSCVQPDEVFAQLLAAYLDQIFEHSIFSIFKYEIQLFIVLEG